jgi:hypothetical protein
MYLRCAEGLCCPTIMIILTLRRLFSGYYLHRMRNGASLAAWRLHTDALNSRLEKSKNHARVENKIAAHEKKVDALIAEVERKKVLAREAPGVERKVKTR